MHNALLVVTQLREALCVLHGKCVDSGKCVSTIFFSLLSYLPFCIHSFTVPVDNSAIQAHLRVRYVLLDISPLQVLIAQYVPLVLSQSREALYALHGKCVDLGEIDYSCLFFLVFTLVYSYAFLHSPGGQFSNPGVSSCELCAA